MFSPLFVNFFLFQFFPSFFDRFPWQLWAACERMLYDITYLLIIALNIHGFVFWCVYLQKWRQQKAPTRTRTHLHFYLFLIEFYSFFLLSANARSNRNFYICIDAQRFFLSQVVEKECQITLEVVCILALICFHYI